MPYEQWNKQTRIKERGDWARMSWTVASGFGLGGEKKVTLVLEDTTVGNTFYSKHIRRYGDKEEDILLIRNAQRMLNNANSNNDRQAAVELINLGATKGITVTGAPASTGIDLRKINFNALLFDLAKGCYAHYQKGKMTVQNQNYNFDIELSQKCIDTVSKSGKHSWADTIEVGAQINGDDGAGKLTFSINHCGGAY